MGVWKINIDGAYNHTTRRGGIGFVIRDFTGNMVAGGASPCQGLLSAEHAEILACSFAIDFGIEQGFSTVVLETDAQEVCRQLNASNIPNTTLLGRIYDDVWA